MRTVAPAMLKGALDTVQREKEKDPAAGIFVAKLNSVPPMDIGGQTYFFYGARVLGKTASGSQPFVTPHLHRKGMEPYLFQLGTGEMNFGKVAESGDEVIWNAPVVVNRGDEFVIHEGEVHSFRNVGDDPVDFVFSCPETHLIDKSDAHPEGDRHIVKDLRNGIPEHFNK
ncbi:hypothetical protein HYW59_02435 [Candidatus Kaiserbacteria bacterium]|nr:hypothetical protein [Candidatus Kaiserbacteria bacterium]